MLSAMLIFFLLASAKHLIDLTAYEPTSSSPGSASLSALLANAVDNGQAMTPASFAHIERDQAQASDAADKYTSQAGPVTSPYAGEYVAYAITDEQTLVQRSMSLVTQRPAYRGRAEMRCARNTQACQNACFYQNCIIKDSEHLYYEPGDSTTTASRANVGVGVDYGTPCMTWPFGQKFYDPFLSTNKPILLLQTDEWPMNQMQRANFNPNDPKPQYTLRCMRNDDNSRGGGQILMFRVGNRDYAAGDGTKKKPRGKYYDKKVRKGNDEAFIVGDWYKVEFVLDDCDAALIKTMPACQKTPDCRNDGKQFHMTTLRGPVSNGYLPNAREGKFYDHALHNTYRMSGEDADIRQFHIKLTITGSNNDQISASVYTINNGAEDELAKRKPSPMEPGKSFELSKSGFMTKTLKVERGKGACSMVFTFTYGSPLSKAEPWKSFTFKSTDSGYTDWALNGGEYCKRTDVVRTNKPTITTLICTFPGW